MYIVITPNGVYRNKSLKKINKLLKSNVEELEMKQVGKDKVINLTEIDIDFVQDKARMAAIPIKRLYKSDNSQKYIMYAILLIQFILLVKS
ncbi:MAG: hypothetical protein GYA02_16735 [Clostridiaceae bacterium]|nr:hypothetical protein [Clostridiaceae bacterium]